MTSEREHRGGLTRREAMARALKAGAYAAPVVLSAGALAGHVGASPPPGPAIACGTTSLSFVQDALLLGVFPGSTFNVYAQPNTVPTPFLIGTLIADAQGVAPGSFSLPLPGGVPIPFGTTSITLSVYLTPGGGAPPAPPAAPTFSSPVAGTLACTSGATLPVASLTPRLLAKVIQEQTGCPAGSTTVWRELVDANIVNASPSASYDIYIRANNGVAGAFVPAGTVGTNAQGNGGAILTTSVATTGGAPTGVTVNAVPSGSSPTVPGALTFAAGPTGDPTTSTLITVSCAGAITSLGATKPVLIGVR
jgi:hypothetical protein